jgi:imidazolonepropionase-like amidohydrolase
MKVKFLTRHVLLLIALAQLLQSGCLISPVREDFVHTQAPLVALTHVRVIDGTGAPIKEDQTIIIEKGRISALGNADSLAAPPNARTLDLRGYTVIPGLVGMHEHLFYAVDRGKRYITAAQSFTRLYLASGVTSIRTAGTLNLKEDLKAKRLIDEGKQPGPKIHITSPYIHAAVAIKDVEETVRNINDWADQGVTSLKLYTDVGRSDLATAVEAAHRRGLKVTGHLCAVGFREAAALGIDNLEHGLAVDTEFYSRKKTDDCPEQNENVAELVRMDVGSAPVQQMIKDLVSHNVAITSTLAVFETFTGRPGSLDPRTPEVLAQEAYDAYHAESNELVRGYRANSPGVKVWEAMLKKEMEFEREFAKAGGLLVSGVDPTGWGGVVAGFGDQRAVELLVEAGFKPEEAIRIASANGAELLGESDRIGTLTVGKQADIAVIRGNPSTKITDIRNVEIVFKDGVGYDTAKLITSVQGAVGRSETDWMRVVAWIVMIASICILVARLFRRKRLTTLP